MMSAQLYAPVFLYSVIIFTIISCLNLQSASYQRIQKGEHNFIFALLITILFAIWIGLRPSSPWFGDSYFYAHTFNSIKLGIFTSAANESEWVWNNFTTFCAKRYDVSIYFLLISLAYFGFSLLSAKLLTPNNVLVTLLFILGSFSFYSYGTNGLRNGLGCSITLVAISFLVNNRKNLIFAIVFSLLAVNIHRSTMLPIMTLFASLYVVKKFKWAYTFWLASIILSLIAGGAIGNFFAALGFDDRVSYITNTAEADQFSHTGFRWDFLVYSMMPIILGYYVIIKKGIEDKSYNLLLNTYTLANAFWVMIIRASFSNRFAYLSWFMYPVVLAYPLIKLNIWGSNQGKNTAAIMIGHVGFTWFMNTIY